MNPSRLPVAPRSTEAARRLDASRATPANEWADTVPFDEWTDGAEFQPFKEVLEGLDVREVTGLGFFRQLFGAARPA